MNLYALIKKHSYTGFSVRVVKKIAHSILKCLDGLNKNRIIHCDIKPENILLKQQGHSGIKVIDFGSSCFENQTIYTYIQSRYYRAPEVILGTRYGMPIDMWSLGCVVAELLTGRPLFPGGDEDDQLALIVELIGLPTNKTVKNLISSHGYPRNCTSYTMADGKKGLNCGKRWSHPRGLAGSKTWTTALKGIDDAACIDFIKRCLDWDPATRMTPVQGLHHSWFKSGFSKSSSKIHLKREP